MRNYTDSNISEHQMMKILKTKPSDNDKIARISRRSTLSNQEYLGGLHAGTVLGSKQPRHQNKKIEWEKSHYDAYRMHSLLLHEAKSQITKKNKPKAMWPKSSTSYSTMKRKQGSFDLNIKQEQKSKDLKLLNTPKVDRSEVNPAGREDPGIPAESSFDAYKVKGKPLNLHLKQSEDARKEKGKLKQRLSDCTSDDYEVSAHVNKVRDSIVNYCSRSGTFSADHLKLSASKQNPNKSPDSSPKSSKKNVPRPLVLKCETIVKQYNEISKFINQQSCRFSNYSKLNDECNVECNVEEFKTETPMKPKADLNPPKKIAAEWESCDSKSTQQLSYNKSYAQIKENFKCNSDIRYNLPKQEILSKLQAAESELLASKAKI